jgi:predicted dehydrogenase
MDTGRGLTRREFAQATAAGAFAILSARSGAAETNGETLKVGLLGCGSRGTGAAINLIDGNENVKITAMADLFADRLDRSKRMLDRSAHAAKVDVSPEQMFTGLDAYQEILKTDVDIVIEATLPYSRPKHITAIVDAGKHLFTEKPAAVDPVGVREVVAASKKARENNLSIVAGTQRRHQKEYVETVKKIQDGAIGEIVSARAYWCDVLPFVHDRRDPAMSDLEYRIRNWYSYCWVSGDNIVEQHVHNLDVINWIKGAYPVSVFASGGRTWKPNEERFGDIYDHFACDFEYADGTHLTSMSRHWKGDNYVFEEVVGTKGRSRCMDMGERGINPYVQEHIDLVASIRGTGPYLNEGEQMAYSTLTAIMGRMSAYIGEPVTWDEALNSDSESRAGTRFREGVSGRPRAGSGRA